MSSAPGGSFRASRQRSSDLKTDVIKDVEREHTITGDFVGPRSDEMPDDQSDDES